MFSKTKTPSELTNSNMLERITLLENNMQHMQQLIQNNQFLIQKVTYLENALNESHQKLERRITDYTDVWHPMMTANIVRVKEELVDTVNASVKSCLDNVIESEVKSIVKSIVQSETQTIIDNLQTLQTKFDDTNIEGHTIIGYNDRVPAFIHIGYKSVFGDYNHNDDLGLQLYRMTSQINSNNIIMTLKSIKQLHNIFNFTTCDLHHIYDLMFFDDNRNDKSLRATERCECKKFGIENRWYNKTNAQYLLSILDELKIKIVFQGSESYNQMPLRRYIL
jgi:hypothetical protein